MKLDNLLNKLEKNDGIMKQLTGKDPLTGRKLFHDP